MYVTCMTANRVTKEGQGMCGIWMKGGWMPSLWTRASKKRNLHVLRLILGSGAYGRSGASGRSGAYGRSFEILYCTCRCLPASVLIWKIYLREKWQKKVWSRHDLLLDIKVSTRRSFLIDRSKNEDWWLKFVMHVFMCPQITPALYYSMNQYG